MSFVVRCLECGRETREPYADSCPSCGGGLNVQMDLEPLKKLSLGTLRRRPIGVWRYAEFLPVDSKKAVSLKEGGTPLYDCRSLAKEVGVRRLHVKHEGMNPTGSFKDRGMTVGVSRAVELRCKVVGCASTGNTSASLAAYAAKAELKCVVLLPSGKVALGKLAQALFYGARVIMVDGNFDDALMIVRQLAKDGDLYILNSINPFRPEGQKTIGFEIADQLGAELPDKIVVPVGNAANIWAIYKGLKEWQELGWIDEMPQLIGVQAEGSNPIARAFREHRNDFDPVAEPETIATAIRIGNPASGKKALRAIYETDGYVTDVSDKEILDAQVLLGRKEGIGVEPASAAAIAGVVKLRREGIVGANDSLACVCTGNVLKDPDTVIKHSAPIIKAKADVKEIRKLILEKDRSP
ncbi:MAG: threonine synthase [Methanomassiliicoccales archaeon]|nr:threonine synthase [Methanomassiliicoccales archaeon]